ncbi:MAG: 5'-nucleotidase [Rhodocyclales bacterium]|nr:5'-nucleotidase [Rhodocyclales bacterium]
MLHPLPPGPFLPLLAALHRLRADSAGCPMKIRIALVIARSAPAHERRLLGSASISVEQKSALAPRRRLALAGPGRRNVKP